MKVFRGNTKSDINSKYQKHNRSSQKRAPRVFCIIASLLAVTSLFAPDFHNAAADTANTTFTVNVVESLSVSVTTPTTWASGNIGDFLRNLINVSVTTNNPNGFTASMYSQSSTSLTNTTDNTKTLPTLASSRTCTNADCTAFDANRWGYSLNDSSNTGTYYAMKTSSSPITLITGAAGTTSGSQDVYFGARANINQASGTYVGTVIISVVTGTINSSSNPAVPTNPDSPSDDNPNDGTATYTGSTGTGATKGVGNSGYTGTTVYTTTSTSSGTTTTTTEIGGGDVRSSYASPAGVTEKTVANINNSSSLATGLATTATVAAASGIFFFIVAKRREDDEEDEEEEE
ncbi:hypothetical protein IKG33_01960 [Candidatus Saccharibacteria bacterium]|nr:hypothetical protein [Candidatus Saccharibacteria bacterium]